MCLLITMIMMGAVNLVICDIIDPYTEDCKPCPTCDVDNSTTPGPGDAYKNPIKPIEKCCPVCKDCHEIGGTCKIRWLPEMYPEFCDFTTIDECRDYSCTCCIKCGDDKCSPCSETGGECRVECRSDETEDDNNNCPYSGCKCCKQCELTDECTDVFGTCVTDPTYCPIGSFASTGCCGGCYCCKPVLEGIPPPAPGVPGGCQEDGAYCTDTAECATGFYSCFGQCQKTLFENGLERIQLGYCCVPKQIAAGPGVPGRRSVALPNVMNQLVHMAAAGPTYGRGDDQF